MKRLCLFICLMVGIFPLSAQTQAPLPPIIPTDNPSTFNAPALVWDWEAYTAQYWRGGEAFNPLAIRVPDVYAGTMPTLPIDLAQVAWVDELGLNDSQLALLSQNGFIVVPAGLNFFDDAYVIWNNGWDDFSSQSPEYRPFWYTSDAVLHTLYLNFENMLKFVELDYFRDAMSIVLSRSYSRAYETYQLAMGTPIEAQARGAVLFLAVGLGLFNAESDEAGYWIVRDVEIREEADAIIRMALQAVDVLDVPFLAGYEEDFSQYKPRGHYDTDERLSDYFRGMMWLGRITFLAKDDSALITSLLVLKALAESGEYERWAEVADFITFLVGDEDNFGPQVYLPMAREIFGDNLPIGTFSDTARLETFRLRLAQLPGPQIANVATDPANIPPPDELLEGTRGFRFFGQRFTFDAYVLQNLVNPFIGADGAGQIRPLPSALDVATALGSDVAYRLLEARGETGYEKFTDNLTMLRNQVNLFTPNDWLKNIYSGWLWTLQPLFVRRVEAYPPMMNTRAWQLRDLQTGLASYSELKHATVLYAAQPEGRGGGGGGDLPELPLSFVEPNPYVFARIAVLGVALQPKIQAFAERSLNDYSNLWTVSFALQSTVRVSAQMAHIAHKQLVGELLTEDERAYLKFDLGDILRGIRQSLTDLIAIEDRPPFSAIVTDIAGNADIGAVLQIGTGKIDYIYVVTTARDGSLHLARGAVYSFYEFTNDINNRLTDTQWRDAIMAGQIPPRPEWVNEFMGQR